MLYNIYTIHILHIIFTNYCLCVSVFWCYCTAANFLQYAAVNKVLNLYTTGFGHNCSFYLTGFGYNSHSGWLYLLWEIHWYSRTGIMVLFQPYVQSKNASWLCKEFDYTRQKVVGSKCLDDCITSLPDKVFNP